MPATTVPLAPNVPQPISIKYVDIFPADLTKNNGKGYGPSLRLKGTIDGKEAQVYPKGFLNKAIEALVSAGVIADGHYAHDPAEKYSIPVEQGEITVMMAQPAGERYPKFHIVSGTPPAPASRAAVKSEHTLGPPLPNEIATAENTVTVIASGSLTFKATSQADHIEECGELYGQCAAWIMKNIVPAWQKHEIPFDASALNAATATLMIQVSKR